MSSQTFFLELLTIYARIKVFFIYSYFLSTIHKIDYPDQMTTILVRPEKKLNIEKNILEHVDNININKHLKVL